MINIVQAHYVEARVVRLFFSDGCSGDFDVQPLIDRSTVMVKPLEDDVFFQDFFIELGALCWKNGFELSPESLYQKLSAQDLLKFKQVAA